MITSVEEYLSRVHLVNSANIPTIALLLPSTETIYEIDLKTRKVNAPEYLSVKSDHFAETIYFKCDRYFDNMDLTETVCIVQYWNKNANDDGHFYAVPFYDIGHFQKAGTAKEDRGKILIPWCISGNATRAAGDIEFAFHFYQLSAPGEEIVYSLNTLPAKSKILYGLGLGVTEEEQLASSDYLDLVSRVNRLEGEYVLYWEEA